MTTKQYTRVILIATGIPENSPYSAPIASQARFSVPTTLQLSYPFPYSFFGGGVPPVVGKPMTILK